MDKAAPDKLTQVRPLSPDRAPSCPMDVNDVVVINVGGQRHEVLRQTLDKFPGSLLNSLDERSPHYRKSKDEYFFDRHPGIFLAVLNFYRTSELHIPEDVCSPSVKKELDFWGIDEEEIEQCCWIRYKSQQEVRKTLGSYKLAMAASTVVDVHALTRWQKFRRRIWDFLDDPKTSKAAKVYAVFSFMVTLLSIVVFCCDTHPDFRKNMTIQHYAQLYGSHPLELFEEWYEDYTDWPELEDSWIEEWERENDKDWNSEGPFRTEEGNVEPTAQGPPSIDEEDIEPDNTQEKMSAKFIRDVMLSAPNEALELLDMICMVYFCIEFFVRFVFCPSKARFFVDVLNVIDIVSILPFFIETIVNRANKHERYKQSVVDGLFVLKVLRIFRIFRLMRHHSGLRVLVYTMRASWRELLLLIVFLLIGMVLFASLVFYADHGKRTFLSIPHAFWWSIVTMTTLGYGDMVPKSDLGYLVGAICAVSGVLVIAFTVPTIVNNFIMLYRDVQYEKGKKLRFEAARYESRGGTDHSEGGAKVESTPVTPLNHEGCLFTVEDVTKSNSEVRF